MRLAWQARTEGDEQAKVTLKAINLEASKALGYALAAYGQARTRVDEIERGKAQRRRIIARSGEFHMQ